MGYVMDRSHPYVDGLIKRNIHEAHFGVEPAYAAHYPGSRGWVDEGDGGRRGYYFDEVHPDIGPVNGPFLIPELVKAVYLYAGFMVGRVSRVR